MTTYSRISARRGQIVALNASFFDGGVASDPYAIRRIDIYKDQVVPHNLVATIPILLPTDPLYPVPLVRSGVGIYTYNYNVPADADVPNAYIDVWSFFSINPCDAIGSGGTAPATGTDPDCPIDEFPNSLLTNCHRFWVYPDNWFSDDNLQSISFGFEPLNQRFSQVESRYLEVGLMPLPLYDFNYNLIMPMVPFITGTIEVRTLSEEVLVDSAAMSIGLRQGSYRTNPFVLRWIVIGSQFLIGTYKYRVKLTLPNGLTQASEWMNLVIR